MNNLFEDLLFEEDIEICINVRPKSISTIGLDHPRHFTIDDGEVSQYEASILLTLDNSEEEERLQDCWSL
jgi:hypothetical protein